MTEQALHTTLELSIRTKRHTSRILRDVRLGRIASTRVGRDVMYTPEQFAEAVKFYREDARALRTRTTRRHRASARENGGETAE